MERLTDKITNIETGKVLAYRLKRKFYSLKGIQKLGAYEDAEEQGLLLRLPVAEGSTVYTVKDYLDCEYGYNCPLGYAEGKNDCEKGFCCKHEHKKYFISETKFNHMMLDKIGKTVFLTKGEAEQALKQMGE